MRRALFLTLTLCACAGTPAYKVHEDQTNEPRLTNVRQLTFGGENAEAYWSWSGDRLIFQMRGRKGVEADQIFIMDADGSGETMVSTGLGKTTCSYFLPGDEEIVYASTHLKSEAVPEPPPATPGVYTWPLFRYDIIRANADGSNTRAIFSGDFYNAEPTVGPDGRVVFTSGKDGDLDIYSMDADGGNVTRLTDTPGYEGGPFYSHDGKLICYRANHPKTPEDLAKFRDLLASDRVQPSKMDIWVMNADGTDQRQITDVGGASFCPFFHPDNQRIIFASNYEDPRGRVFNLYMVNVDGTALEKVTDTPEFDGFPMFSPDGKRVAWASNRHGEGNDTNVFVADWVE